MKNKRYPIKISILVAISFSFSGCFIKPKIEVLKPFGQIKQGIEKTIDETNRRNNGKWGEIEEKLNDIKEPELTKRVTNAYVNVFSACDSLYNFIEQLKKQVVEYGGLQTYQDYKESLLLTDPKNLVVADEVLIKPNELGQSQGDVLKSFINNTREVIALQLEIVYDYNLDVEEAQKSIPLRAQAPENSEKTWKEVTFGQIPKGAAIALLTKFQYDTKNAETEFLRQTQLFLNEL